MLAGQVWHLLTEAGWGRAKLCICMAGNRVEMGWAGQLHGRTCWGSCMAGQGHPGGIGRTLWGSSRTGHAGQSGLGRGRMPAVMHMHLCMGPQQCHLGQGRAGQGKTGHAGREGLAGQGTLALPREGWPTQWQGKLTVKLQRAYEIILAWTSGSGRKRTKVTSTSFARSIQGEYSAEAPVKCQLSISIFPNDNKMATRVSLEMLDIFQHRRPVSFSRQ